MDEKILDARIDVRIDANLDKIQAAITAAVKPAEDLLKRILDAMEGNKEPTVVVGDDNDGDIPA